MNDNWVDYWNRKDSMTGELWRAQADFFVRQVTREISIGPDDVVLDIGCGQGHVIAALASRAREAHGADTSEHSVAQSRERHAGIGNLHFHALPKDDYLALDRLPVRNATRILCVSVVQYYRSLDELRTLIAKAKSIAAPGCRMLVADLLVDYSLYKDVLGVLLGGLQSGTFLAKLREVVSGNHSLYARIRAKNPVLTMTRRDLERVCADEGTSLRFIPCNLTGNCFRAHALIDLFPTTGATEQ